MSQERDSNPYKSITNRLCYRYTIPAKGYRHSGSVIQKRIIMHLRERSFFASHVKCPQHKLVAVR